MGCPCSKPTNSGPSNPLQQLQQSKDTQRGQQKKRIEQKRQRQLAKLQKRHAKKRSRQRGSVRCKKRSSGHGSGSGSGNYGAALPPQMRLLGGSNGSTTTECTSALYARTLEQQHEEHQRIIEQKMRQQLEQQLNTFLLNQLVLITQFFGHFERELDAIDEEQQLKRRQISQLLTDQTLLFASTIDAAVAKRLKFKPIHGAQKQAQPLQTPRTYVIFENVDIARPNDANYDSIATLCKVLMETDYYNTTPCRMHYTRMLEQTRWKGYVRLKLREQAKTQRSIGTAETDDDDAGIYTDGSSGYSTAASIRSERQKFKQLDGDYDHVYIAQLNTHRSIAELKLAAMSKPLESNVLPEACVSKLANFVESWMEESDDDDDEDEDEDEEDDDDEEDDEYDSDADEIDYAEQGVAAAPEQKPLPQPKADLGTASSLADYETVQVLRQCRVEQERRRNLLQQSYLNSQQFMNYFGELLRQQLASQLHISHSQLSAGTYQGCSIYTAAGEVVPAIHVPHSWPECAFEFNLRERPLVTNPHTGQQFQWPTLEMRKRIQSFGFHVVPVGYAPKRHRNPFREVEWRIVFPQAEQFLERQLTNAQLKVFILMKALFKTFVQPHEKSQAMGHAVEHLRAHLFWECERHYNDWPEEFLGEVLVRFVRSFAVCLAKKELPDYFIPQRNLFEHVPEDALMALRSIMSAIAEQPLMHLLLALRNLEHASDFYTKLDYRRLYENLVTPDYLQLRSWAKYSRNSLPLTAADSGAVEQGSATVSYEPRGLLGMPQHQERTRGKLRRKTQMLRAEQQQQQRVEQRRDSIDSLDMELLITRTMAAAGKTSTSNLNDGVEILRRTNLLELLMDHMLLMIGKSNEFRNLQHAHLYLAQTQRLCRLYKLLGCSQYAQHYAAALCEAAHKIEETRDGACEVEAAAPPMLPHRRSPSVQRSPSGGCAQRSSTKFVEHLTEVHASGAATALELQEQAKPTLDTAAADPVVPDETAGSTGHSPLNTVLTKLHVDVAALQALSAKTGHVLQTLAPEAKREELLDILRRKTDKLKSAFKPNS